MILSICILNYNTKDLTIQCLSSLFEQYEKQIYRKELEIIVVDNNSNDGSSAFIKNKFPKVIVFENKENSGFSKGQNIAAKIAKGKYLFFLNSDTQVKDDHLFAMTSYLDSHKDVGVLGARLYNPDGSEQLSAGKFYTFLNFLIMLISGERVGFLRSSPKKISEVDWVMGASFMIKKRLFDVLGGFDEHFFMYVEDMELCFRVRKKGYAVMFYPDISIIHEERGSSNRSFAVLSIYEGILYFYKKHKNYIQYKMVRIAFAIKACFAVTIGVLVGNKYLVSIYKRMLVL